MCDDKYTEISRLILLISNIDSSIPFICRNGSCYRFAQFLEHLYPNGQCLISTDKEHVVYRYGNKAYDITGEANTNGYTALTEEDVQECEKWSFYNNYFAGLECTNCGEIVGRKNS